MRELVVVPAVDLKGGKCVRLVRGEPSAETVYSNDPLEVAWRWVDEGAECLHVVDLDAALGEESPNAEILVRLCRDIPVAVQVGGGVRTVERAAHLLDWGADRVIFGTAALLEPEVVREACRRFPGRIAVSVDVRGGKVAVRGWTQRSEVGALTLAQRAEAHGACRIVYTNIDRDGTQQGVDVEGASAVARAVRIPVTASGGVGSLADIRALRCQGAPGIDAVIVGRALYTGAVRLADAICVAQGLD